jgi:hypothetical protein
MKIEVNKKYLTVLCFVLSYLVIFSCEIANNNDLNFESLIGIKKDQLQFETELYNINKVDSNHFILNQKKSYSDARNFNILIKTDDIKITDYIVFNDFSITDIKRDSTHWILLLSDINQTNKYWESEQQIQFLKLDNAFKELWKFITNINTPLNGRSIKINESNYAFTIEVITGCQICFVIAEVVLTKSGEFMSVRSIGRQNSSEIPETELQRLFDEK